MPHHCRHTTCSGGACFSLPTNFLGIIVGIIVGIVVEASPGERRVAMVPSAISVLNKTGVELLMQPGAGAEAGFPDAEYVEKGVRLAANRAEVFRTAEVILQVRSEIGRASW